MTSAEAWRDLFRPSNQW